MIEQANCSIIQQIVNLMYLTARKSVVMQCCATLQADFGNPPISQDIIYYVQMTTLLF